MYWVLSIISYNCSVYKYTNGNFSCKGNGGKQYDDGVRPICSYVPESLQTKEPCAVVVLQKWAKTLCKTRTYFTRTLSQMIKQNVSSIFFTQAYLSLAIFRAKKIFNFHCKTESERSFEQALIGYSMESTSIPENVQSQYLFEKQWRWRLRPTSLAPCFQLLSTNELFYPVLIHITHFSKPHRYVSSPANTVRSCAKTLFDFSLFGDNYTN